MMYNESLAEGIKTDNQLFIGASKMDFILPEYHPDTHYLELTRERYFYALLILRHYVKRASDEYFSGVVGAKNVDLFMMTPSVSSPMGLGSDSEAISFQFGKQEIYLTDSSQFGFEPLLLNGLKKVYCYLPSIRGENPDERHLNQFYHCEAEMVGHLGDLLPVIVGYIQYLANTLLFMPDLIKVISLDSEQTFSILESIINLRKFESITFDEAVDALIASGQEKLVNFTEFGRDISGEGEIVLAKIFGFKTPFWIRGYDIDRVPFYLKADPKNSNRAMNADLIFPPIIKNAFGGEIVGCGQRQDTSHEIEQALLRQRIDPDPYRWYMNLRTLPNYQTTSGFGLGIERFITWALCRRDIKNVIPYPRLKGVRTYP